MAADEDLISDAKEAFREAAEFESEMRTSALDDLKFAVKEEQWPEEIRRRRELDGRPVLTRNLLGPFIRQVVNDGRQNRPSMIASPADDAADPFTAEMITGLLRHIQNNSRADIAYDTALEFAVSGGFGYLKIGTEFATDDSFDRDLKIQTVANPFKVFGDPTGEDVDGSDWMSAFEVEQVPEKAFRKLYKDAKPVDWDELGYARLDETWMTGVGDQRRILVANWWRREVSMRPIILLDNGEVVARDVYEQLKDTFDQVGAQVLGERSVPSYKVSVTKLSGAEILEPTKPWAGKWIPIVPVYGHVISIDGERRVSSLIRSAKDAQRSYNFHSTTATELTALAPKAPFIGPKGAFKTDLRKWQTANTETWPFIEYDLVQGMSAPPQRQAFSGVPAGEVQAANQAASDMRAIIGMYESDLGMKSNETSGKAIIARQRAGDTSTFHYIDNLNRALRQAAYVLLDLIPKVYQPGRVVRVLGQDMKSARTLTLGQPSPQVNAAGETMRDPQGNPIDHLYDLTVGKYDVVLSAGPGYATKREEAASQMVEFIRAYPPAAPLIGDLLAKNLDWPGADEIAARLKAMMPSQATGGPPPEVAQIQQALQSAQNEVGQLKQNLVTMQNDRGLKAREVAIEAKKLQIDAYEAETKRMAAMIGKDGAGVTKDDLPGAVISVLHELLNGPDSLFDESGAPGPAWPAAPPAPMEAPPVTPAPPQPAQPPA